MHRSIPSSPHVRPAARAIMQCRTAALGGHVQACPDGHVSRVWDNSCRQRSCPQCAYLQPERWLALQRARRLACAHAHGLFPLPHALHPWWLAHVPVMTTLLLQAVRDTLRTFLAAPKYLGAQPGIIAALHTWSQTLVLHRPLPCLVTGGGLTAARPWGAVRQELLLPVRVVMAVVRGQMLDAIRQAWARGALVLPDRWRPQLFVNLRSRLGHPRQTPWNVWIMERYRHGAGVVTYLARYRRGGPIKNARLVGYDGARVTFTYRGRAEEPRSGSLFPQRLTFSTEDLLQRWRLHVPAPQARMVRYYGRYHHTQTEALAICRAPLGQPPLEEPVSGDWQTVCARWGDGHPEGARPVVNSWCAPASAHVAVHRRQRCLGSVPHAVWVAGAVCEGDGVPGASLGLLGDGRQDYRGASRACSSPPPAPQPGGHAGATGWIP